MMWIVLFVNKLMIIIYYSLDVVEDYPHDINRNFVTLFDIRYKIHSKGISRKNKSIVNVASTILTEKQQNFVSQLPHIMLELAWPKSCC